MKFTGYFILAAAGILIISSQETNAGFADLIGNGLEAIKSSLRKGKSRNTIAIIEKGAKENEDANVYPEATRVLKNYFINATNMAFKSEKIFIDGITKAKKLVLENPEDAKKVVQLAIADGFAQLLICGMNFFKPFGEAFGLSNEGARPGLSASSARLQSTGLKTINALNNIGILFSQGMDGQGKADLELCDSILLIVKSYFGLLYTAVEKSIQEAYQALRDAQNKPIQEQFNYSNCQAASKDSQGSDSIKLINEASDNALKRGANYTLVKKFKESGVCLLGDFITIAADGKDILENARTLAKIDSSAAITSFFKSMEPIKKRFQDAVANTFLDFGRMAFNSGNQSNEKTKEVISAIETGKIHLFLGIKSVEDIIATIDNFSGEELKTAFEAAAKSGFYGKLTFIQSLIKAIQIFFSFL